MKLNKLLIATFLSASVSGPALASTANETILSCDNGKALIQVDPLERRHVRLVITDKGIVDYLLSRTDYFGFENSYEESVRANFAYEQHIGRGLFRGNDFSGFSVEGRITTLMDSHQRIDTYQRISVFREGRGLKVVVAGNFVSTSGEGGGNFRLGPFGEKANWYFPNCVEQKEDL